MQPPAPALPAECFRTHTSLLLVIEDRAGPPADACAGWIVRDRACMTNRAGIATDPHQGAIVGKAVMPPSWIGAWSAGRRSGRWCSASFEGSPKTAASNETFHGLKPAYAMTEPARPTRPAVTHLLGKPSCRRAVCRPAASDPERRATLAASRRRPFMAHRRVRASRSPLGPQSRRTHRTYAGAQTKRTRCIKTSSSSVDRIRP